MKKQIAILATIIAASGFTAFGQDWITVADSQGNGVVWDSFTSPGVNEVAGAGVADVEVLWALQGTADPLGNSSPTNGTSSAAALATISSMLSGGWTIAQNYDSGSGSAALGTVFTDTGGTTGGKGGSVVAYNGGDPFEIDESSTGATGSDIELLYLVYNSSASSWSTASALGWSSMYEETIGLTAGDVNATEPQTFGESNGNSIGVNPVPEPTTLALAGLGGLSMLFLRRRKA
jgi:hypothetical protein